MKLKELVEVTNRFDNWIEVRTGNEWYYDVVEKIPMIQRASEDTYESEYADRKVCSVYAYESMHLVVYLEN